MDSVVSPTTKTKSTKQNHKKDFRERKQSYSNYTTDAKGATYKSNRL